MPSSPRRRVRTHPLARSLIGRTPPVLEGLGLTMEQFIDLCILAGCDYCNTIRGAMSRRRGTGARVRLDADRTTAHAGVGPKRALALIQQHGSIETVIKNLDKAKNPLPDQFPFEATRELFKHPNVPHHSTPCACACAACTCARLDKDCAWGVGHSGRRGRAAVGQP